MNAIKNYSSTLLACDITIAQSRSGDIIDVISAVLLPDPRSLPSTPPVPLLLSGKAGKKTFFLSHPPTHPPRLSLSLSPPAPGPRPRSSHLLLFLPWCRGRSSVPRRRMAASSADAADAATVKAEQSIAEQSRAEARHVKKPGEEGKEERGGMRNGEGGKRTRLHCLPLPLLLPLPLPLPLPAATGTDTDTDKVQRRQAGRQTRCVLHCTAGSSPPSPHSSTPPPPPSLSRAPGQCRRRCSSSCCCCCLEMERERERAGGRKERKAEEKLLRLLLRLRGGRERRGGISFREQEEEEEEEEDGTDGQNEGEEKGNRRSKLAITVLLLSPSLLPLLPCRKKESFLPSFLPPPLIPPSSPRPPSWISCSSPLPSPPPPT